MDYSRPEWAVPGCLDRETKVGECCPLLRDRIKIIPQDEWADYIGQVSLKQFVWMTINQLRRSSCASAAVTGAVMDCEAFEGKPQVDLNHETVYSFVSGGRDRGSSLDANLRHARDVGILPNSIWPRAEHAWNEKPPLELFKEHGHRIGEFADTNSIEEFGSGLLAGHPGVYARRVHALFAHELLNDRRFGYTNSYGEKWGDNGQAQESLSVIEWRYGGFFVLNTI